MERLDIVSFRDWSAHVGWADLIDIAVVAVLSYLVLSWVRSHSSHSLLVATVLVLVLWIAAQLLDLYLTSLLFQTGAVAFLLAILLIFQDDLRRAAERFAFRRILADPRPRASSSTVDLVVDTARELADARIGALLVFPGRESLERLLRGGERLHGELSRSLLMSIFHTGSPGHDGAVVIEGDRVARFAAHLPLSRFPDKVGREGTRHSAALGLAEASDAFVVAVSEERGVISVAHLGTLESVDPPSLRDRLERFLAETRPEPPARVVSRWLVREPGLKLMAVCFACLLWLGLAFRVDNVQRQYPAPIEYRNLPAGWAVEEMRASRGRVTLSGSARDFDLFDPSKLVISLNLEQPRQGEVEIPIIEEQVLGVGRLNVSDIDPKSVQLNVYRVATMELPIRVRLRDELPANLRLTRVEANPATIRVQAPASETDRMKTIETEAIDLSRVRQTMVMRLHPELPPRVRLAENQPAAIEVTLFVAPAEPPPKSKTRERSEAPAPQDGQTTSQERS